MRLAPDLDNRSIAQTGLRLSPSERTGHTLASLKVQKPF